MKFSEKLLFTKHLSIMIRAGIPLTESFDTLQSQTKSKEFKKVLIDIESQIKNGESLTKAFGKYPKIFDQYYLSMVGVGEEAGTLEKNLQFLADQLNKENELKKKVQAATIYPGIVLFATAIIGGFISLFILPQLVDFFNTLNVDLPLSTRVLMWFATLMKNSGVLIIVGFIFSILGIMTILKTKKVKPHWHRIILKLPIIGNLIKFSQISRFALNFGTLLSSGIPTTSAIETTAMTMSNLSYQNDLKKIGKLLAKGKPIGESLSTSEFSAFPSIVGKMITVGEKTGRLDETLLYLADYYEDEIDTASKTLATILEPILLLTIALVVAFVALAIISPIYELTNAARIS